MKPLDLLADIYALEDNHFDLIYPPEIRELSDRHWTPVRVARRAAEFLVREPGMRVLDIGCGPGKFCIVGALTTSGKFTGVEQRKWLSDLARAAIEQATIPNAEIIHGDVAEINFSNFDAFYIFNPFEENLEPTFKIDATVKLSGELYEKYTEHVARQLAIAPLGTRVVTYCGSCEEVPLGYECLESSLDHGLKFWEKTKDHPVRMSPQDASASNNKCRFSSDSAFEERL